MRPAISVTIIAGNEEDDIVEAVHSASWAEEVLVLDSESEDATARLAADAGARVAIEAWRGYGAQKNRAAELASHDWVFSLDADERFTDGLIAAIDALPAEPKHPAFSVRRRNHVGGRPIRRWPWSWDTCRRLYDRRRGRFNERAVHESLETYGRVGALTGHIEHLTYDGVQELLERQKRYARLGAEEAHRRGREPRPGDLTLRPVATFLRHWLVRGYALDGVRGLRLSAIAARGTRLKYQNLRELSCDA